MADYNSAYTGPEVDMALSKTDKILEWIQVFPAGGGHSPTSTGVSMSGIGINPGTGDKTGIYDVIYADDANDIKTSAGRPNLSRIWIGDEGQFSGGSGHASMTNTTQWMNSVDYEASTFNAFLYGHVFGSGTSSKDPIYIHAIYRLQEIV